MDLFLPYFWPEFTSVVVSGWPETLNSSRIVRITVSVVAFSLRLARNLPYRNETANLQAT